MSAHTPGPWRLEKWVGEYHVMRPAPKGMPTQLEARLAGLELARVTADHSDDSNEGHANAQLIASAPDLLASVTRLLMLFDTQYLRANGDGGRVAHAITEARAAIAKAEGTK